MRVISDLNIVKSWGRICGNGTLDVDFTINGPLVTTIFPSLLTRCCILPTSYIYLSQIWKLQIWKLFFIWMQSICRCNTTFCKVVPSRSNDHKRFLKPLQSCLKRFTPWRWWRLGGWVLPLSNLSKSGEKRRG